MHLELLQQQLREVLSEALPSLTAALSADLQDCARRYAALAGRHTTCHALNSLAIERPVQILLLWQVGLHSQLQMTQQRS